MGDSSLENQERSGVQFATVSTADHGVQDTEVKKPEPDDKLSALDEPCPKTGMSHRDWVELNASLAHGG